MATMVGRNTAFLAMIGVGLAAVLMLFLSHLASEPSMRPADSDTRSTLVPEGDDAAGEIAAMAQGVRVRPTSSTARVMLTPSKADQEMLDSIVLADEFDSLLARARREPAFAHTLASALNVCTFEAEATRKLDFRLRAYNDERDEREIEQFDSMFSKCRGLGTDRMALRFELAEQAARAGVLQAQLNYSNYISRAISDGSAPPTPGTTERYRRNAAAFVLAAARSGDPEGLYAAYRMYRAGYLVPQDLVLAYQYAEQFGRVTSGPTAQQMLDQLASQMTPEQLRRARGH
jgi:TPR repeat protein